MHLLHRLLIAVTAAVVLALTLPVTAAVASPADAPAAVVPAHPPHWMTTPCAQEDGSDCYWDARTQGNGYGHSFYAVRVRQLTCRLYWRETFARSHNQCLRL